MDFARAIDKGTGYLGNALFFGYAAVAAIGAALVVWLVVRALV